MIAIALCIAAFIGTYIAARRSLVSGLLAVLLVGYLYGILRANIRHPASHFIADLAVGGLLAAQLFAPVSREVHRRLRPLRQWVLVLVLWPTILLLIPVQDPLVQVVGFRGAVLVLGFLLLGGRLSGSDLYRLALGCSILNLAAFGLAGAEYVMGIEPFFPENEVTEIMYRSRILVETAGPSIYRIPSSFSSAHAYGGTMVVTMPLLLGGWVASSGQSVADRRPWHKPLFAMAIGASAIGVFMSAARQHAVMLFIVILAATLAGRIRATYRIGWVVLLLGVAAVVSRDARLQRFTSLENEEYVVERVQGSVNKKFLDYAAEYPMGNGLGGGGTSMPYFLRARVKSNAILENEYGRIMLELGVPGLLIWIGFVLWLAARGASPQPGPWNFGRRLAWVVVTAYFATAAIGLGLMTSVPQSFVFFLLGGWIATKADRPRRRLVPVRDQSPATSPVLRAS